MPTERFRQYKPLPGQPLHTGYERLIGTAITDRCVRANLLSDPQGTALRFGITADEADLIADVPTTDLQSLAAALVSRLYGDSSTAPLLKRRVHRPHHLLPFNISHEKNDEHTRSREDSQRK